MANNFLFGSYQNNGRKNENFESILYNKMWKKLENKLHD